MAKNPDQDPISVSSVSEGFEPFAVADLWRQQNADILQALLPQAEILRFPAWDTVPYDRVSPTVNIIARRTDTLGKLAFAPETKRPRIIAASVGAVLQKLPPKRIFLNSMKEIKVGESLNFNDFLHYASINGYSRIEQVMEPGEYAVRGDILDIFPGGGRSGFGRQYGQNFPQPLPGGFRRRF